MDIDYAGLNDLVTNKEKKKDSDEETLEGVNNKDTKTNKKITTTTTKLKTSASKDGFEYDVSSFATTTTTTTTKK